MRECMHTEFNACVEVTRLYDEALPDGDAPEFTKKPNGYQAAVRIWCKACGVRMRFLGLPAGLDMSGAATSADATEARLAVLPEGEVQALVDGAPQGFSVRKKKN